ncbi:MAG: AAA family ATPase, partial [Polyangiaceae bacterium]
MTPTTGAVGPRCLVAVNERARAARLFKRDNALPLHLWVVPQALWKEVLAGQSPVPAGFAAVPTKSWKRGADAGDVTTRVNKLTLVNFRRFEELSLSFAPGMNVLAGQNGAGKTTVLDALAMGLADRLRPLHPGGNESSFLKWRIGDRDVRRAPIEAGEVLMSEPQYPARIEMEMLLFGERKTSGPAVRKAETGPLFGGPGHAIPFLDTTDVALWA